MQVDMEEMQVKIREMQATLREMLLEADRKLTQTTPEEQTLCNPGRPRDLRERSSHVAVVL